MHTTHMYEKRGPWADKKWDKDAYVMPNWSGRMATTKHKLQADIAKMLANKNNFHKNADQACAFFAAVTLNLIPWPWNGKLT